MNPTTSFDQIRSTALDLLIRFGPKALVAILILVAGSFVSRAVSRWMLRVLGKVDLEPPVRTLLARVAWAITFILFIILALQNLGVELLPLIAGLSVAGASGSVGDIRQLLFSSSRRSCGSRAAGRESRYRGCAASRAPPE